MSTRFSRRDFLRMGALSATAAVVSGCTINLQRTEHLESYVEPPEEGLPGENLWYASTCRQCAAGCGIIVRVSAGRARKVEGNPLHPINRGKLCARGQAALQGLYDPDRLRGAVRQEGRGSRQFTPLSWPEALSQVGDALAAAGSESVAFLGGNLSTHMEVIVRRFLAALGGRPPAIYALGDQLAGRQGLRQASEALFGTPALPVYDIGGAEAVYSFGAHFTETWLSPVYYSRAYGRMRRGELGARGYLVHFEPRMSSTAACADRWVPLRPGTEGWVALALGRILVDMGYGEARYAPFFEDVDVGAVAEASGVSAETLARLARTFADVARPLAIPGGALAGQQQGTAALRAVQGLNLLAGRQGEPGGLYLAPSSGEEAFAPSSHSTYAEVQDLVEAMRGGQIEVLLLYGSNPLFELPPSAGLAEAMEQVPLVVSFRSIVDATAAQADLILPDHTALEGWGYHVPPIADRVVVSGQQPVMRPLHDTRASADVLLALAQQGGGELAQALPWPNEVAFLREQIDVWRQGATSAEAFWADWRRQGGHWQDRQTWQRPSAEAPAAVELAPPQESEGLALYLYPSITLPDGRGANRSWLQEAPDPMTTVAWQTWVELHPHTAERLGLRDDDVVRVISSAGEIEAIVYLNPGVQEEVAAIPVGRGHQVGGRFATWSAAGNPIALLGSTRDGESGGLAWAETRVRLSGTGRRRSLARLESPEGVAYLRGDGH